MGTLWFALNIWNEEALLPGCLQSIRKYAPDAKIVAVEGAYKSFNNEVMKQIAFELSLGHRQLANGLMYFTKPESTDKTMEILKDYAVDTIIDCETDHEGKKLAWSSEFAKRSQYFVGKPGDAYFVLDADERIVGNVQIADVKEEAYNVMLRRDDGVMAYPVLRVFKHMDGMKYEGAHHALWVGDRLFTKTGIRDRLNTKIGDVNVLPNVIVEHLHTERGKKDPLRHVAKGAYYRNLTTCEEAGFRNQYGL